ncbi:MAG: hypothetical protein ACE5OR_12105 [bacterium]
MRTMTATVGGDIVDWEFLTDKPSRGMTESGIFPIIVGTCYVSITTLIFAVPPGMFAAISLSRYAKESRVPRLIRSAIRNLSSVLSIVYGLF